MTLGAVATAIERFPAVVLYYGGGRHILVKKTENGYAVKEAKELSRERDIPVLKVTGRSFNIADKLVLSESPVQQGLVQHFVETTLGAEAIAASLFMWGCPPAKFLTYMDGAAGGFKMVV